MAGGLGVELRVKLDGWRAKSARTKGAVRLVGSKAIRIGPSRDNVDNVMKARASFDRGDDTYPVSDAARAEAGEIIARGIGAVADGRGGTAESILQPAADRLLADVQAGIRAGLVDGPARSQEWIDEKGNDLNMVGTTVGPGKFVDSLEASVVPRSGAGSGAGGGGRDERGRFLPRSAA